jgi:glucose/arabinose dehydrogenase
LLLLVALIARRLKLDCRWQMIRNVSVNDVFRGVAVAYFGVLSNGAFFASSAEAGFVGRERVASGVSQALAAVQAPGDPTRLFVATKAGTIRIVNLATKTVEATPFLTIADTDVGHNEAGLLGLAFHPDYQTNGKFYVNVTVDAGGTVIIGGEPSPFDTYIREYTVSANPNIANTTPKTVLRFPQPRGWHNGGWLAFGPEDDKLYGSLGDGGYGFVRNPESNILGSIFRIDVDDDDFADPELNYAVPDDNPFVGADPKRDELWAYGLRNPWRSSFDRATHDLWIGDVGQDTIEEVNFLAAGESGADYGWPFREGTMQAPTSGGGPKPPGAIDPTYQYLHPAPGVVDPFRGSAVIGGFVYRGPDPTVRGMYVFGDSSTGRLWMFDPEDPLGTRVDLTNSLPKDVGTGAFLTSFGEDADGNLYVTYSSSGEVYRLVTDTVTPGDFNADGYVDGEDLAVWRAGFGTSVGADARDGDADADGDVDGNDFLAWQRHVGTDPLAVGGNAQSVPEPAGVGLYLGAGLALSAAAKRRAAREAMSG